MSGSARFLLWKKITLVYFSLPGHSFVSFLFIFSCVDIGTQLSRNKRTLIRDDDDMTQSVYRSTDSTNRVRHLLLSFVCLFVCLILSVFDVFALDGRETAILT